MRRLLMVFSIAFLLGAGYLVFRTTAPSNSLRPAKPVKLATGVWEPYVGPGLKGNGPVCRIVSETVQRMGYEPQFSFSSWDLILAQADMAEVLGVFPFISTRARAERYEISDPILAFEYVLFFDRSRIENPDGIRTASDIRKGDYRFGRIAGYEVWPELDALVSGLEVVEYDTSAGAFRALANGDIDFLPEGRIAGLAIVRGAAVSTDAERFGFLDVSRNPVFGATEGLCLLMSKSPESREFLKAFNAKLAKVKQTLFYREALAEINRGSSQSLVELRTSPDGGYVKVSLSGGAMRDAYVPAGTRAAVIEWPEAFIGRGQIPPARPVLCRVKLLNGPLQGRVVRVDARAVALIE